MPRVGQEFTLGHVRISLVDCWIYWSECQEGTQVGYVKVLGIISLSLALRTMILDEITVGVSVGRKTKRSDD